MSKISQFEHPTLGEEIVAIGGRYALEREEKIEVDGRDVLYLVGYGAFDTSCCGVGGCAYALVPGYLIKYKHSLSANGRKISNVEPVDSEEEQKKIESLIREKEKVTQVNFL